MMEEFFDCDVCGARYSKWTTHEHRHPVERAAIEKREREDAARVVLYGSAENRHNRRREKALSK